MALDRVRTQADELDAALGEFGLELRKGTELSRAAKTRSAFPMYRFDVLTEALTLACSPLGVKRGRPICRQ